MNYIKDNNKNNGSSDNSNNQNIAVENSSISVAKFPNENSTLSVINLQTMSEMERTATINQQLVNNHNNSCVTVGNVSAMYNNGNHICYNYQNIRYHQLSTNIVKYFS